MWFWLSIVALVFWSGSDLFSKIGCRDAEDSYAHLKMLMAVGGVMGLHAVYELVIDRVPFTFDVFFRYLPVSALYILSMAVGYLGLRYIELSISSPICNSSGAVVAVLCFMTAGINGTHPLQLAAVAVICLGIVLLGVIEAQEDENLRLARQEKSNYKYAKSWLALALPIIYCLLDALGTFADSIVLEELPEASANVAYELTFFAVGLACFVYVVLFRKQKLSFRSGAPKVFGAACETVGQLAYIYAIGDAEHVAFSAPIISAYCALSVLWGRLFLKERLSYKHYLAVLLVLIGIVILGVFDV